MRVSAPCTCPLGSKLGVHFQDAVCQDGIPRNPALLPACPYFMYHIDIALTSLNSDYLLTFSLLN